MQILSFRVIFLLLMKQLKKINDLHENKFLFNLCSCIKNLVLENIYIFCFYKLKQSLLCMTYYKKQFYIFTGKERVIFHTQ
jgi:hypothetical protein